MSAQEHTPGPWQLIYRNIGGPFLEAVADANGEKIRLVGVALAMNSRSADPEPEANARLIAAAPDLLNGCNALLGLIDLVTHRDDCPDAIKVALMNSHRLIEAKAAIAKATGAAS